MIAAADAHDHLAVGDPGGHGDGVFVLRICDARLPNRLPGFSIQRLEAAIDDGRDDHALINRDTAIDHTTADGGPHGFLIDLGIPAPTLLASLCLLYTSVTGFMGACWLVLWAIVGRPPYLAEHRRASLKVAWPNFLERRLWLVVSSFGLGAVALGLVSYLSPLYLNRAFSLSQAQLGKILWIPLVGWEAGYFFWGWIADKLVTLGHRPTGLFWMLSLIHI